jgi:propanediol dehydratase small subunit
VIGSEEALDETLTIQLGDEKLRITTYTAKITVTRCFGRRYTASRYTFSPPDRGIMVPNSSQTKSPQSERAKPMTQSIRDAPTDPTKPRMYDGVENIPVPMMAPTLVGKRKKI